MPRDTGNGTNRADLDVLSHACLDDKAKHASGGATKATAMARAAYKKHKSRNPRQARVREEPPRGRAQQWRYERITKRKREGRRGRDRANEMANCLGAMQIWGIQDICKSRRPGRRSCTKIGGDLRKGRHDGTGPEAAPPRLLHPLKIQPGILLGTDLNNVVGDERDGQEHALHPPSFSPSSSLSSFFFTPSASEIQNLKAARRGAQRGRGRWREMEREGEGDRERKVRRFQDLPIVPSRSIKVIKSDPKSSTPVSGRHSPGAIDATLSR